MSVPVLCLRGWGRGWGWEGAKLFPYVHPTVRCKRDRTHGGHGWQDQRRCKVDAYIWYWRWTMKSRVRFNQTTNVSLTFGRLTGVRNVQVTASKVGLQNLDNLGRESFYELY